MDESKFSNFMLFFVFFLMVSRNICYKINIGENVFNSSINFCPLPNLRISPFVARSFEVKPEQKEPKCFPIERDSGSSRKVVHLVTSHQLLLQLNKKHLNTKHCTVVLFFAHWCPFSRRLLPIYHSAARVFPQLDFVAIEAHDFNQLNSRYGTVSVPNLILFQNGKSFNKYNSTERSLPKVAQFISNSTGLFNKEALIIEKIDDDFERKTRKEKKTDMYLVLSWLLIIISSVYYVISSEKFMFCYSFVLELINYRPLQHHHID